MTNQLRMQKHYYSLVIFQVDSNDRETIIKNGVGKSGARVCIVILQKLNLS